jgi:hypothetical protein
MTFQKEGPMSRSSGTSLILFGAVFLLVGAIFLFIGCSIFLKQERYQRQGVRGQAVTLSKALHRATADTETSYEISYRFSIAGGTSYERTESVPVRLWESVEKGSPLTVEYINGEPDSVRVVRGNSDETVGAIVMLSIGGVLALIGLMVLARAMSRHRTPDRASHRAPAGQTQQTESANVSSAGAVSQVSSFWPLARRSFGFWFGGIFLVCGLPFFLVSVFLFYDDWRFAQEARSTQGLVLTKEIRVSRSRSRRSSVSSRTKHYEVTYRFTVDGETFEGRDELSHEKWEQLTERGPVEVLYRPQKASSNRLAGRSNWLLKTIFGVFGSVFAGVGGIIFVRAVRKTRLESHLRQHGVRAQGTVLELEERNIQINDVQQWRLHYEYRDFQGHRYVSTVDMPEHEAQQWRAGDTGIVFYDPSRPAEAAWLGRDAGAA